MGSPFYTIVYYKFSDNIAWVRDPVEGEWYQSGLYSNEKHFLNWVQRGKGMRFKVKEITVQELFVDLI